MERSDLSRLVLWTLIAFLGVGLLMGIAMWSYGPTWMPGWGWMMPFGMLGMGLPIVLVILLVFFVAQPHHESGSSHPVRTLEDRYARGEISREQFMQMREDLQRGPRS